MVGLVTHDYPRDVGVSSTKATKGGDPRCHIGSRSLI